MFFMVQNLVRQKWDVLPRLWAETNDSYYLGSKLKSESQISLASIQQHQEYFLDIVFIYF